MNDAVTKPSSYPTFFKLLLMVLVPLCFLTATLALVAALPIGELAFRLAASALIALLPLLLTFRASAELRRRNLRGLARAPIAIALMLMGYVAIVGGLVQWRGFRPPHLVTAADHLHRGLLRGEELPELAVVEPRPPLTQIYDRRLPEPTAEEVRLASTEPGRRPGVDGIEIWSADGDFRYRFFGHAARGAQLQFVDAARLLLIRSTGRTIMLDAEKGALLRQLDPPELLSELSARTSSTALVLAGKVESTGERVLHYFDLESGERRASLRSKDYVALAVTADLRRALVVERTKKGELQLVAYHLPSGDPESTLPRSILTNAKGRKLKALTAVAAIGGGEQALLFEETTPTVWDLKKKKAQPFALAKTKLYPYAVVPGGRAYFHRRTDAGDPNPTGLYRLPSGEKLNELEVRGQPPRAFFADDGRSIAVGTALFSTADGGMIAGQMPESFTLEREQVIVVAPDASAFVFPESKTALSLRDAKLLPVGALPNRGEPGGALSPGGRLFAVPVLYPLEQWKEVLEELDVWQPS